MAYRIKESAPLNKLCRKCMRTCRQAESVLLVDCARFLPRPFTSEKHEFAQLDLFGAPADQDADASDES